jgi:hypothetical protein
MVFHLARHAPGYDRRPTEGWLMQAMRRLTERLARPAYLYPDELSPHLRREIGLCDGRTADRHPRP